MTELHAEIPLHDYRGHGKDGLRAFATDRIDAVAKVMDAVIAGMGSGGWLLRRGLGIGDRIAARWLARAGDPYLSEIRSVRDAMGRPGALAFALSFELGCTAKVFAGTPPVLFRTLDWPFRGLGHQVEIVQLQSARGPWVTATWPGVLGVLHGAARGRFAAALNQGPERRTGLGRPADYLACRLKFLRRGGMPPAHLLRRVFEEAQDFATARAMLRETPITAPAIFTLAGTKPEDRLAIERTETAAAERDRPLAANGFDGMGPAAGWRSRGIDSAARQAQALRLAAPPPLDAPPPPILNPLTRLVTTLDAGGGLAVAGFEGLTRVTRIARISVHDRATTGP
ncbi:MAG: hypothetical protein ACFBRM_14855 [Pikeienuella sp.]